MLWHSVCFYHSNAIAWNTTTTENNNNIKTPNSISAPRVVIYDMARIFQLINSCLSCVFFFFHFSFDFDCCSINMIHNHKLNELKPNHTNQIRNFNEIEMSVRTTAHRKYRVRFNWIDFHFIQFVSFQFVVCVCVCIFLCVSFLALFLGGNLCVIGYAVWLLN